MKSVSPESVNSHTLETCAHNGLAAATEPISFGIQVQMYEPNKGRRRLLETINNRSSAAHPG